MLVKMWRNWIFLSLAGIENVTVTLENSFLYINIQLPYTPEIALWGMYLKEIKTYIHIKIFT